MTVVFLKVAKPTSYQHMCSSKKPIVLFATVPKQALFIKESRIDLPAITEEPAQLSVITLTGKQVCASFGLP